MEQDEKGGVPQDQLLGGDDQPFEIPKWMRIVFSIFFGLMLALNVIFYIGPLWGWNGPAEVGSPSLIIFCVLGLCVFLIPWQDYGLQLRKFGPFEFEQVLNTQAKEHAEELADLRERLQAVEGTAGSTSPPPTEAVAQDVNPSSELEELLGTFLERHSQWAFSPSRILSWGKSQPGFSSLARYKHQPSLVRKTLQRMVANGELETRISKRGNTLYRSPV